MVKMIFRKLAISTCATLMTLTVVSTATIGAGAAETKEALPVSDVLEEVKIPAAPKVFVEGDVDEEPVFTMKVVYAAGEEPTEEELSIFITKVIANYNINNALGSLMISDFTEGKEPGLEVYFQYFSRDIGDTYVGTVINLAGDESEILLNFTGMSGDYYGYAGFLEWPR